MSRSAGGAPSAARRPASLPAARMGATTLAPAAKNSRAMPSPTIPVAPVTTATRPSSAMLAGCLGAAGSGEGGGERGGEGSAAAGAAAAPATACGAATHRGRPRPPASGSRAGLLGRCGAGAPLNCGASWCRAENGWRQTETVWWLWCADGGLRVSIECENAIEELYYDRILCCSCPDMLGCCPCFVLWPRAAEASLILLLR